MMLTRITSISVLFYLLNAGWASPEIRIGDTSITGAAYTQSGVEFFGAIPFAEPPVGALRFQPPVLTTTLAGSNFDATNFGPACIQTDLPSNASISEDCLQINIFRPAGTPEDARLPIMFWIYGGGFTTGLTSMYNGTKIVEKSVARGTPVIFASVNYRLGPLGFPQGVEAGSKNLLNLGLKDQVAGLQWVQANIGLFGGDKTKVTIFGESAGGTAVFTLILGSKIEGLARAAIAESTGFLPAFGPERNQAKWKAFVNAVPQCAALSNTTNTVECLQAADSDTIITAFAAIVPPTSGTSDISFFPNIDGPDGFLPDVPSKLTPISRLPIMIGNNRDEGTLFTPQNTNSSSEIRNQILTFSQPSLETPPPPALDAAIDKLLELYPDVPALGSPFGTGNATFGLSPEFKRLAAVYTDFAFQATRRNWTISMSKSGIDVFGYEFTDPDATVPAPIPIAPGSLGVTHASEVFFVYGSPDAATPSSIALSSTMQDYWISFAVTLDPNDGKGNQRPQWLKYKTPEQNILKLDGRGIETIRDDYRAEQMAFIADNAKAFHL